MKISLDEVRFIGAGLARPECVMATRSGELYMPDKRGGVAILTSDGAVRTALAQQPPDGFMPNGIALLPRLLEIDGAPIQPTNFVGIDRAGHIWVTVSTKLVPREQSMKKGWGCWC